MGKYYAVKNGRSTGIYNNWDSCKSNVNQYSGAQYKSFKTLSEAQSYMGSSRNSNSGSSSTSSGPTGGPTGGSSSRGSYGGSSGGSSSSSYGSGSSGLANLVSGFVSISEAPSAPKSRGGGGKSYKSPAASASSRTPYSTGRSSHSSRTSASTTSGSKPTVVYTDGSSLGNGKPGSRAGYGTYWGDNDPRNSHGRVETGEQTNNRGELVAIKEAMGEILRGSKGSYEIRTDSEYSKNSIGKWADKWETNGWKTSTGQPVKNKDLISDIRSQVSQARGRSIDVKFEHVRGHSGHPGNEAADALARRGASK